MVVEEAWLRRQLHSLPHPDDGMGAGDEDPRPVPGEGLQSARGRAAAASTLRSERMYVDSLTAGPFDLPDRLAAKADPALIADDERHFAAIAETLTETVADLSGRLEDELRAPGGIGQQALDRDQEIHRLSARLRTLRRFGLDLCLGRIVRAGNPEPPSGMATPGTAVTPTSGAAAATSKPSRTTRSGT